MWNFAQRALAFDRKSPPARGNLSERDREEKFSGHSSRAGLASWAEIDERYLQKHLGHASAEMTRRHQRRRDRRFRRRFRPAAWRANSLATQACVPKTPEASAGTQRSTSSLGQCRLNPNPFEQQAGAFSAKLAPLVETAPAYAHGTPWHGYLRGRARQGLDLWSLADRECVDFYSR